MLPPDINESSEKFTVVYDEADTERRRGRIRFGLLGVKNLGKGAIEAIIEAREQKGHPKDIFQFIDNLDIRRVNRKGIESLIKAGALDRLDPNRAAHLAVYESLLDSAQRDSRQNLEGQMSLFQTNKLMAFVDLEDLYGITEVVVFPNVYERCQDSIADDAVVVVRGKLNFKEGEVPKVLADSVVSMDEVERRARGTKGPMVKIRIPADAREPRVLKQLEQIFREDQGDTEVLIYLQNGKIVRSSVGVKMSDYLIEELNGIVGASNVKMSTGKEQ